MLKDADFKPVYATGEDEPAEFFLEGLVNSISFDLGLGFFSSSGFRALAVGFAFFIKRGGKMRIIINDSLSEHDKAAIQKGINKSTEDIEEAVIGDILKLKEVLSGYGKHFFNCLSWLIATNRLEIIAVKPIKNSYGIAHPKYGVFKDEVENKAVFSGSVNFSANALFNNVEAISCDYSWLSDSISKKRILYYQELFEKTWSGRSEVVSIIPIEKVKTTIREEFPVSGTSELIEEEIFLAEQLKKEYALPSSFEKKVTRLLLRLQPTKTQPDLPKSITLRDYQKKAIKNWGENDYQGMLEMATGTGKTLTALAATTQLLQEKKRLFIIISCPFIHLAEQWTEEVQKFGFDSILVGESRHLWENEAAKQARLFKRKKKDLVVLVTTNASFSSETFQKIIQPSIEETLLIIDEAHYAGASSIRELLPEKCPWRLGLSATPERHGDEVGTQELINYFKAIVFKFPIKDAIGHFLTNYYYYPIPIELTEEEFDKYCELTLQASRYLGSDDEETLEKAKRLLIKRARLQNNSINKLSWLRNNLSEKPLDFSLFYVGDQIFNKAKQILGRELGIKLHEFTSRQSRKERKKLLKEFANQEIQSLVAMKCLDEGVDIPPTRVAYFLASSSNPREFVQRRGRVLRKYEKKESAIIYDLISIPPKKFIEQGRKGNSYNAVKSAFTKEYKRVQEFASMALNHYESMNEIHEMADQLDLLDVTIK